MQYDQVLQANSVPTWEEHYIHYDKLKTEITLLLQDFKDGSVLVSEEEKELLNKKLTAWSKLKTIFQSKKKDKGAEHQLSSADEYQLSQFDIQEDLPCGKQMRLFLLSIYNEVSAMDSFFNRKESELNLELDTLLAELSSMYGIGLGDHTDVHRSQQNHQLHSANSSKSFSEDSLEKKDSNDGAELKINEKVNQMSFDEDLEGGSDVHLDYDTDDEGDAEKVDEDLIVRLRTLFMDYSNLKSFISLNKSGVMKICKKFDKSFNLKNYSLTNNFEDSIFTFEAAKIFNTSSVTRIEAKLIEIVKLYQLSKYHHCVNKPEFSLDQRNAIRAELDNYTSHQNFFNKHHVAHSDNFQWTYSHFAIKGHTFAVPSFFLQQNVITEIIIVIVTLILAFVKTLNDRVQGKALAYAFFMCANWAFAPMPLFMVSMSSPLVGVLFHVCKNTDGSLMSRSSIATLAFQQMWSSTIMILVSGFTMATALKKYNIAKFFAGLILRKFGKSPKIVVFLLMLIACYLSMFISNVATPVLCFGLAEDMLQDLGANSPLAKGIALAIAFSANIGGMASPISSPQNIVGMQYLQPYGVGWGSWLAIAIPCSLIINGLIWGFICLMFNFKGEKIKQQKAFKMEFGVVECYILLVCATTIGLWCVSDQVAFIFGNSGIVGIIPMFAFFSVGILTKNDFVHFPWDIVGLAMGSLVFGKLITLSGLLATVANSLEKRIGNFNLFAIIAIFGILMLVIGTFVSHTVAAVVMIPLVQQVGLELTAPHAAEILIFEMALLSSCGMALPSSGFPNVTAISQLDKKKRPYLNNQTFIKIGLPSGFISYAVIITLGYGIMTAIFKSSSS